MPPVPQLQEAALHKPSRQEMCLLPELLIWEGQIPLRSCTPVQTLPPSSLPQVMGLQTWALLWAVLPALHLV